MNFKEAKRKVMLKRTVGLSIVVLTLISTVVSIFKVLYLRLDNGSDVGGVLSSPFKALAYLVYENTTPLLSKFWAYSPVPNLKDLSDVQNIYFFVVYLFFFVGVAFLVSGKELSIRLKLINQQIENKLISESRSGYSARARSEIENSEEISSPSIFDRFHKLYLAPVIVAVVGAVIIKYLGG